ncbi:carbon starvation protein A, partial [Lactococcus lactis]|nr:carbon starvation protein A [Lactococcus lactis]
ISLNPGIYYSMNTPQASIQKLAASSYQADKSAEYNAAKAIPNVAMMPDGSKLSIDWEGTTGEKALEQVAKDVGEQSIVSRTGGAPTLAVSMSNILHKVPLIGGTNMMGFWYH